MRILVTGSRDWSDGPAVYQAIDQYAYEIGPTEQLTIVHGDCPTGADRIAKQWALEHDSRGVYEEPHPALWDIDGYPQAGPMRNQRMVDLGADICLAFPLDGSRGTRDCMRRAKAAGIPVLEIPSS